MPWARCQQIGVEEQLQDRAALGLTRELGVDDVVGPGAEGARLLDAAQDVGPARPATVLERRLCDDVFASPHGFPCLRQGVRGHFDAVDLGDGKALLLEMIKESVFVPLAALAQEVEKRVRTERLFQRTTRDLEIELRQIRAIEVTDEVGRS